MAVIMITNTIRPYCYDIAHVLSIPSNFSHRFRYRSKWIKLATELEDIKGKEGLVVLRNIETGGFLPVRYVQIEDILSIGDIHYIEFRVKNYFPVQLRKVISEEIETALVEKKIENRAGCQLDCLVLDIDDKKICISQEVSSAEEHNKWSDILKDIGELKCYKEFSFLRILHIRDANGVSASVIKDYKEKYTFSLKPNRLYYLDLIQNIPWEIDKKESIKAPFNVELIGETNEVNILRKIQRVVGKYDLLRFIFKTPMQYSTKYSFLEVDSKQSIESIQYGLPAIFIPICIQPPKWMKVARFCRYVLNAIASIVFILSGKLSSFIDIEAEWIRYAMLLIILIVNGMWDDVMRAVVKDAVKVEK